MIQPHRKHPLWFAFALHRISGVGLALFLPLHFYVLGLVLTDPAGLDQFLHWTARPLFKFAEFGLVFLLSVHLFGGLRLLAVEFLPWTNPQKNLATIAGGAAFAVALGFLLSAF